MELYRAGGAKAMSSTKKDAATKEMNKDKRKSIQPKTVDAVPVITKLVGFPPDEMKYLRAEMRLTFVSLPG